MRAGIPEAEVILMATRNGALALGIDSMHGSITRGKVADLVVVSGDPLADITWTRRIETVVRAGVAFDPNELLESVRGKLGPSGDDDSDGW